MQYHFETVPCKRQGVLLNNNIQEGQTQNGQHFQRTLSLEVGSWHTLSLEVDSILKTTEARVLGWYTIESGT